MEIPKQSVNDYTKRVVLLIVMGHAANKIEINKLVHTPGYDEE